jgi:glycosyltransferase involved in cell wall biosynthesis
MVTHGWGGGVEQHVDRMTRALEREGVNVFRLQPHENAMLPAVTLRGRGLRSRRPFLAGAERIPMNPNRDDLVEALRILEIDHVHVHHLGGFGVFATEWVRFLPEALGCSWDLTLHDYSPVCPRLHLNLPDGSYCGEPAIDECERCIAINGSPNGYHPMWRWRRSFEPLLHGARQVFCPTVDVAERAARYFPKASFRVRAHPEVFPDVRRRAPRRPRAPGERLRVAVPGAIGEQKGFALLVACADDARERGLPLEFRVVGYTMSDAVAEQAGIEVSGRYAPGDAERLLAESGCDVAFLPSTTPETYCFTLSSVLRVELFPVVFDMGALAERVRDVGFGEVLPSDLVKDAASVNDRLLALDVGPPPDDLDERLRRGEYASLLDDYYALDAPD